MQSSKQPRRGRATARSRSRSPAGSASRSCGGTTAVKQTPTSPISARRLRSHVKFTGQATILPGWYAGYVLHLEAIGSDSLTISQEQSRRPGRAHRTRHVNGVSTLQSFWFVKSDQLGKVSVGTQSDAADNAAILVDGSGSLVPANWVAFDVNSFFIRDKEIGSSVGLRSGAAIIARATAVPGVTATVFRVTSFVTTRRRSAGSRFGIVG